MVGPGPRRFAGRLAPGVQRAPRPHEDVSAAAGQRDRAGRPRGRAVPAVSDPAAGKPGGSHGRGVLVYASVGAVRGLLAGPGTEGGDRPRLEGAEPKPEGKCQRYGQFRVEREVTGRTGAWRGRNAQPG